jgi:hypothetical protein
VTKEIITILLTEANHYWDWIDLLQKNEKKEKNEKKKNRYRRQQQRHHL